MLRALLSLVPLVSCVQDSEGPPTRALRALAHAALSANPDVRLRQSDGGFGDFGDALASAGDIDGDGFADVIVGAPEDSDVASNSGSVYVFYGSATGLDPSREQELHPSSPLTGDDYGGTVAGVGDLNGDGYDDVAVGARYRDVNGRTDSGTVYVYYGSASGVDEASEQEILPARHTTWAEIGAAISGGGDIDGDGYDDLVLGSYYGYDDDFDPTGAAHVFYGGPGGLDVASEQKLVAFDRARDDRYGQGVLLAGDVDGDGFDDVLVGSPRDDEDVVNNPDSNIGSIYLYYGSASGLDGSAQVKIQPRSGRRGHSFGVTMRTGDLDGDGELDLVVGDSSILRVWHAFFPEGGFFVYRGTASGFDVSSEEVWRASDTREGDQLGTLDVHDIDGDGFSDVLVGARGHDTPTAEYTGAAYVLYGGPGGLDPTFEDKLQLPDPEERDWFGGRVAAADVDGDGLADAVVAARGDDSDPVGKTGSISLFYGSCRDLDSDGYCPSQGDCDDQDSSVGPGEVDHLGDGVDSDCDGVGGPDSDEDGDGLTWTEEQAVGTSDAEVDSDDDGLSDADEVQVHGTDPTASDSDLDGVSDGDEVQTAGTNPLLADTDGDRLSDGDEIAVHGSDPRVADTDGDGLPDGDEVEVHGTLPTNADTDDDGLGDGEEVQQHGTDPGRADTDGDRLGDRVELIDTLTDPLTEDTDGDGLGDGEEVLDTQTDALLPDTDGDGLLDGAEVDLHGTNPREPDTDGDGIRDGDEVALGTLPTLEDSDGDDLSDAVELDLGTDPTVSDTDDDGLSDGAEVDVHGTDPLLEDSDGDALGDGDEVAAGTDPLRVDSDDDGLDDGAEVARGTDPLLPDTDADGLSDGDEVDRGTDPLLPDTDADGLSDGDEVDLGTDPRAPDSDGDGIDDGDEVARGLDPLVMEPGSDVVRGGDASSAGGCDTAATGAGMAWWGLLVALAARRWGARAERRLRELR